MICRCTVHVGHLTFEPASSWSRTPAGTARERRPTRPCPAEKQQQNEQAQKKKGGGGRGGGVGGGQHTHKNKHTKTRASSYDIDSSSREKDIKWPQFPLLRKKCDVVAVPCARIDVTKRKVASNASCSIRRDQTPNNIFRS